MIQFIKLQEEHLEMVMQWRLQPEVSQYMLTDISSDFDKQLQWFQKVSYDETCRYWIIVNQNSIFASISNCHNCMYTAIIKLNTLTDSNRTTTYRNITLFCTI